jgi:hypothetical protein
LGDRLSGCAGYSTLVKVTSIEGTHFPLSSSGIFARSQARLGPGGAAIGVDRERLHIGQVENDPAVGDAVPGDAVAAAADGQLQPGLARKRDDARDVSRVAVKADPPLPIQGAADCQLHQSYVSSKASRASCSVSALSREMRQAETIDLQQHAIQGGLIGQWPRKHGRSGCLVRDLQPGKPGLPGRGQGSFDAM